MVALSHVSLGKLNYIYQNSSFYMFLVGWTITDSCGIFGGLTSLLLIQ